MRPDDTSPQTQIAEAMEGRVAMLRQQRDEIAAERDALAADLNRALAYARALEDRCDYLWHQWHPDTLYGDPIIDDWPEMYGVGDLLDREG